MKRAGFAAVLLGIVLGVLSPAFAKECPAFTVAVTFRYVPLPGEEVRSVSLRGSFNNWGEWPMEREPDGSWAITVCLAPGEYQYKFYINGQWPKDMATARGGGPVDPEAHGYVDDGFGGQNAVRIVTLPVETFFAHHDPANPAFLCRADGRWVVRLLVAPGFVESVTLATDYGSRPMERQLFWDSGEMWRVSLDLPFGFSYRFHIRLLGGEEQTLPEGPSSFSAPEEDPFPQVAWVGKSVGYQIFPDRFYNGDPANDALALDTDEANFSPYASAPILSAWNDPITPLHCCHQYFGGDLRGIREKLDYLAQLGVGLIYLNPIFVSGSAHGYDTHDFLEVAPRLGTKEELRALLEEAHTQGIRVIFDFVPNHTGVGFWAFQDVVKRGPESPYWDWYFIRRWPFTPGDGTAYEGWWGLGSLPKLNTANPEVFEYLLQVALYWLDFGFDGMRIDVPNELLNAEEFFSRLRAAVKAKNPEFYIVGEIWQIAPEWVRGRMFDTLMNYALGRGILLRYAKGEISGEEALARLSRYYAAYGENVTAMGFNLVSSHDTSRMLSDLGGGDIGDTPPPEVLTRFKLLLTLLFTQPGMPVIFQGEERGLLGRKENFDAQRYPIPWEALNLEVFRHVQKLVRWREELPELTESKIRVFSAKGPVFAYFRGEGDGVLVLANNSSRPVPFALPPGKWRVLESGAILQRSTVVPPLYAWVLVREKEP
jgi:glycosidase